MERVCNLYVNDTHLMIKLFEHIKKEISFGTKIILLSEDTSPKGLKNMKEKLKQQKISDVEVSNHLREDLLKKCDNTSIIVQGSNKFIEETENLLNMLIYKENINVNIISCYNISRELNINEIINKYEKILNTSGVVELNQKCLEDMKN